ncbi:MAG: hypothetical protein AAF806_04855 [Bacteroidota bacterium]
MRVEYNGMPSFGNFDGVYERTNDFQPAHSSNTCDCWKKIKTAPNDEDYVITNDGSSWIIIKNNVCPTLTLPFNYPLGTIANSSNCDPSTVNGMTAITEFPSELAVYYGYPSLINGSNSNIADAVEVYSNYDIVIFPQDVELEEHPEHENAEDIIQALQTGGNSTQVFGYIDLGTIQGLAQLTLAQINTRIAAWNNMGVAGIFFDDVELGFGVDRARMNAAIDEAHILGLPVMVNGNIPDEIFSATYGAVSMQQGDWYMVESFHIRNGDYYTNDTEDQDLTFVINKYSTTAGYSLQYGVNVAAITTSDYNDTDGDGITDDYTNEKMSHAWWLAVFYGFDTFGWGEPDYSASGQSNTLLPFRTRPTLNLNP